MKRSITLAFAFLIGLSVFAKVDLPSVFTSNMVLQQNADVKIWGKTDTKNAVVISMSWADESVSVTPEKDGSWKTTIPTPSYGGPYTITVSDGEAVTLENVLVGEVWLCSGQSNMEMPMKGFRGQPVEGSNMDILKSANNNIRFVSVPRATTTVPRDDFNGEWQIAGPATVADFSATAYYFARLLNEIIDIPVGIVEVSYGGSCVEAWTSRENTNSFNGTEIPKIKDSTELDQRTPTTLFNGMLSPVIGYTIKGAVWYQGETNYINATEYAERFATMVKEWRSLWGQGDFPFYYMQIAPFDYSVFHAVDEYKPEYNSAFLREAQFKALDLIPNSDMAVALDIGHKDDIHPPEKKVCGERLAFLALAEQYDVAVTGYKPPCYKSMEIQGSTVVVSFDNIPNGIDAFGKEITEFEIAGADKHFYPAQVFLRSKSVVVSSPRVKEPVAVRYAFKDVPEAQLFSNEGIPVISFRTDNW